MDNTLKTKKKTKKSLVMTFLKLIIVAYLIVFIIMMILNTLMNDKRSIYEKIGSSEPYSISIKDALSIKEYGLMTYVEKLKSKDFKSAYAMLSEEYRAYISLEEYKETLKGIDFDTINLKDIKMKTNNTYVGDIVYKKNGSLHETIYIFYLNEINPKIISISPDKFIYGYENLNFKMDGIELKVKECNVYADNINLIANLKNTSLFETLIIENIGVGYDESINKNENIDVTLAPGEAKEIVIDYETNYYIPNNIKLKRLKDEETLRTYTFYFDKAK